MAHNLTYFAVLAEPPTGDPRCRSLLLLPIFIRVNSPLPLDRITAAASIKKPPKKSPPVKPRYEGFDQGTESKDEMAVTVREAGGRWKLLECARRSGPVRRERPQQLRRGEAPLRFQ